MCLDQCAMREACGGKGTKACTTNSAHERLMQQEQLSSIVSLQISSAPHFASQCVSSKRARGGEYIGETNKKKKNEGWGEKAKYQDFHCPKSKA